MNCATLIPQFIGCSNNIANHPFRKVSAQLGTTLLSRTVHSGNFQCFHELDWSTARNFPVPVWFIKSYGILLSASCNLRSSAMVSWTLGWSIFLQYSLFFMFNALCFLGAPLSFTILPIYSNKVTMSAWSASSPCILFSISSDWWYQLNDQHRSRKFFFSFLMIDENCSAQHRNRSFLVQQCQYQTKCCNFRLINSRQIGDTCSYATMVVIIPIYPFSSCPMIDNTSSVRHQSRLSQLQHIQAGVKRYSCKILLRSRLAIAFPRVLIFVFILLVRV